MAWRLPVCRDEPKFAILRGTKILDKAMDHPNLNYPDPNASASGVWKRVHRTGRMAVVIGLVIFLAGGYMTAYGVGVKGVKVWKAPSDEISTDPPTKPASRTVCFWMGLAYLAGGVVMMFGCWGLVIDKNMGHARRWTGLIVPMLKKDFPLSLYGRVEVGLTKDSISEGGEWTIYPVALAGENASFTIDAPAAKNEAMQLAKELSSFLGWPLSDNSDEPEE
jgi:hypothetical protein